MRMWVAESTRARQSAIIALLAVSAAACAELAGVDFDGLHPYPPDASAGGSGGGGSGAGGSGSEVEAGEDVKTDTAEAAQPRNAAPLVGDLDVVVVEGTQNNTG